MDERKFHIFQLMARMVEMVFNKRNEWDHDDVFLSVWKIGKAIQYTN